MLRYIDSHCHVHFEAYKNDMDDVVRRNLEAGVGMITVGTQSTTSKKGIELAERYENVWATIGLHPNHVHKQAFFDENELPPEEQPNAEIKTRAESFDPAYYRELAVHPKVVAIGECGLDYYRLPEDQDREVLISDQKREFAAQLAFATEVAKPLVIHCREAHADQAELLEAEIKRGGIAKRGVIHSFTGTALEAARYRELGFSVGFNGILTFSKSLQEVVREIPLSQILLETDAPYLTPPPHRGKRNEPQNVVFIAELIAQIKGITVEEVANATREQTITLFGLTPS